MRVWCVGVRRGLAPFRCPEKVQVGVKVQRQAVFELQTPTPRVRVRGSSANTGVGHRPCGLASRALCSAHQRHQVPGKQALSQPPLLPGPRRGKTPRRDLALSKPQVWPHMAQPPQTPPQSPVCAMAPAPAGLAPCCPPRGLRAARPPGCLGPEPLEQTRRCEEVRGSETKGPMQPGSCPEPGHSPSTEPAARGACTLPTALPPPPHTGSAGPAGVPVQGVAAGLEAPP